MVSFVSPLANATPPAFLILLACIPISPLAVTVTPEATDQEASSERCSLDDGDVERNADLYVFNHEVAHG